MVSNLTETVLHRIYIINISINIIGKFAEFMNEVAPALFLDVSFKQTKSLNCMFNYYKKWQV